MLTDLSQLVKGFGKLNRVEYFTVREHAGYRKSTPQIELLQTPDITNAEAEE